MSDGDRMVSDVVRNVLDAVRRYHLVSEGVRMVSPLEIQPEQQSQQIKRVIDGHDQCFGS